MKKHKEAKVTSHFASEVHANAYESSLGKALEGIDPSKVGIEMHTKRSKKRPVWEV